MNASEPPANGDKPKALLGIEPFDGCLDRFRSLAVRSDVDNLAELRDAWSSYY